MVNCIKVTPEGIFQELEFDNLNNIGLVSCWFAGEYGLTPAGDE